MLFWFLGISTNPVQISPNFTQVKKTVTPKNRPLTPVFDHLLLFGCVFSIELLVLYQENRSNPTLVCFIIKETMCKAINSSIQKNENGTTLVELCMERMYYNTTFFQNNIRLVLYNNKLQLYNTGLMSYNIQLVYYNRGLMLYNRKSMVCNTTPMLCNIGLMLSATAYCCITLYQYFVEFQAFISISILINLKL